MGFLLSLFIASSIGRPISSGFFIGINDCSSSDEALPSQKKYGRFFILSTEGVFLLVGIPLIPMLNATVSANAYEGIWQLAQLTVESRDNIFSENSFFPNASFVFIFFDWSLNPALTNRIKADKLAINRNIFLITAKLQVKLFPWFYIYGEAKQECQWLFKMPGRR